MAFRRNAGWSLEHENPKDPKAGNFTSVLYNTGVRMLRRSNEKNLCPEKRTCTILCTSTANFTFAIQATGNYCTEFYSIWYRIPESTSKNGFV
jgi:hypothetical protein